MRAIAITFALASSALTLASASHNPTGKVSTSISSRGMVREEGRGKMMEFLLLLQLLPQGPC